MGVNMNSKSRKLEMGSSNPTANKAGNNWINQETQLILARLRECNNDKQALVAVLKEQLVKVKAGDEDAFVIMRKVVTSNMALTTAFFQAAEEIGVRLPER